MTKLRRNIALAILFTSALVAATPLARAAEPAQPAGPFPLMAWDHAPLDPAVLAQMRECGLTIAGFVTPNGLDLCHEAGLKAIVQDPRTYNYDWTAVDPAKARADVEALVKEVGKHSAVFGYNLRDEPTAAYFHGLAAVSGPIKEFHPGAWPYINLFPNYADAGQLGAESYDAYLEKFIEVCQPTILSYDHYALMEGGGMRDGYFANLEAVRRAGLKHNLPIWNIVQALGCLNFREPSLTDLRFQAYTSLAYGIRGIGYFKYFSAPVGNFRQGAIDHFGGKTETWNWLRNVNMQVQQLAPTLLKLKSDRVYHFGEIPPGCTGPDGQCLVTAAAGSMLVGEFTHEDGTRYVLAVNKDFGQSIVCQLQYRTPPKNVEQVSSYNGSIHPYVGEYTWLAPGQGALLKLTY